MPSPSAMPTIRVLNVDVGRATRYGTLSTLNTRPADLVDNKHRGFHVDEHQWHKRIHGHPFANVFMVAFYHKRHGRALSPTMMQICR